MKKRIWFSLALVPAVAVSFALRAGAQGQTPAPAPAQRPAAAAAPAGNAENGRKLFVADGCYQCHGYEAQGSSVTGPRLGPQPIAFAQFTRYVRTPSGQMPPYTAKVVSDRDLADMYAFVQSRPQPPSVESIPLLQ